MTLPEGQKINEVEAYLANKVHTKGLIHLSPDEVATAYKSKFFPEEYRRLTGSAMPATLRSQMAERLNHCGRLRDESASAMVEREAVGPAFLRAVAAGEAEAVNRWLESKDRRRLMGTSDDHERGCLHLAAKSGHVEVLRLLNDHGAELEARDRFNRTPLHLACEYGHREAAEVMLGYDCQAGAEDTSQRTALHLAACCEDPQIARLLAVRQPALLGRRDQTGRTPLFYSVLNKHPLAMTEITRHLLELQSEPNARDAHGMTSLHYAAQEGKKNAVSLLLQKRADPTLEDSVNGHTPVVLAARHEGVKRELQKAFDAHVAAYGRHVNGRGANPVTLPAVGGPGRHAGGGGEAWAAQPPWQQPLKPPPTLGTPLEVLQERFVKIMERVQEGGLEQREHLKRPHLFTASWMTDVSSHQQLLGQALKYVPGPEVCIRVFNLLRPPNTFPVQRGDEKFITEIYEGNPSGTRQSWGGIDPYAAAMQCADDLDDLSQARRVELLRAIHDQKKELEAKELQAEELRRKVEGLQADIRERGEPGELQALRDEATRAKRQQSTKTEELEGLESRLSTLQGQNRVLQEQLGGEKLRNSELLADQCAVRTQLQALMTRRGEEQAWQEVCQQEKRQTETLTRRFEDQLREAESSRLDAEEQATRLRSEVRQLEAALAQSSVNSAAEAEAERYRSEASRLNAEVSTLRRQLEEVMAQAARDDQGHRAQVLDQMQQREISERDVRRLRADVAQLPKLEAECQNLMKQKQSQEEYWKKMFREYHLIGQAFFGGPSPADAPPLPATPSAVPSTRPAPPPVVTQQALFQQPATPAGEPRSRPTALDTTPPAAVPKSVTAASNAMALPESIAPVPVTKVGADTASANAAAAAEFMAGSTAIRDGSETPRIASPSGKAKRDSVLSFQAKLAPLGGIPEASGVQAPSLPPPSGKSGNLALFGIPPVSGVQAPPLPPPSGKSGSLAPLRPPGSPPKAPPLTPAPPVPKGGPSPPPPPA